MTCTCDDCVSRCTTYPGWMTPDEARAAMDAGMADRLMLDYWIATSGPNIYALAPARADCDPKSREPLSTGELLRGSPCVFLTGNNRCEIHDSGFKPRECATSFGCRPGAGEGKRDLHPLWNTPDARALIERWRTRP